MAFGVKKSFFGRMKEKVEDVIFMRPSIDEDMIDELEEALAENLIDKVTFDIVKGDAAALIRALTGKAPALEALCREILNELIRKL